MTGPIPTEKRHHDVSEEAESIPDSLKIVVFTINDPVFTPIALTNFVESHRGEIVCGVIAKPINTNRILRLRREYLKLVAPSPKFLLECFRFLKAWLRLRGETPTELFKRHNIRVCGMQRFDNEAIQFLTSLEPDIFLFCPFNLIAGPRTLAIPKIGTFNMHMARLPEYQGGVSTFFWSLFDGSAQGGVTLHEVSTTVDEGAIVSETCFAINHVDVFNLMTETFRIAGELLMSDFHLVMSGDWTPIDTSGRVPQYRHLPARIQIRKFLHMGLRFAS